MQSSKVGNERKEKNQLKGWAIWIYLDMTPISLLEVVSVVFDKLYPTFVEL
jgi:hypothetical protein